MENEVIPQVNIASVQGLRRIDFIDNDFAIFDDVSDVPMDEFPNRINAAVIAVCLTGSGKVGVNLREFEVTAGTLLMTLPDQIIQSLGVSDDFSAIYIAVSPSDSSRPARWSCSTVSCDSIPNRPKTNPPTARRLCCRL